MRLRPLIPVLQTVWLAAYFVVSLRVVSQHSGVMVMACFFIPKGFGDAL